jgi:hypothetical protein
MRVLIIILILNLFFSEIKSQSHCVLVLTGNNHCYTDESGKVLYSENIDPIINEKIFAYKDGLGRIRRKGKFGFINHKGEIKIPLIYDKAEDFNEGLAEVEINGKWCYINTKGEIAIKPVSEAIHHFSEGLAVAGETGHYGYINYQGEYVVKPVYARVNHFKNGKAWVLSDGKWGCINKKGEFIIEPTYDDTFDFSEGYAWVKSGSIWGLIDSLNKFVIPLNERNNLTYAFSGTAKNFGKVSDGLLIAKANGKTGYCQIPSLKKTILSKFDNALNFADSTAIVRVDGKYGVIDVNGKFIVEPIYKEINRIGQKTIFSARIKGNDWGFLDITTGKFNLFKCKNILYLEKITEL